MMLCVRNIWYAPDRSYQIFDPKGIIRSHNYFATFGDHGDLPEFTEWQEQEPQLGEPRFNVIGVEDPRLYWQDGAWRYIGSVRQHRI